MISNTAEVPMLAGGFISLDMVQAEPITKNRRTKIICTIGPASWSKENLGKLMDAGMNMARLNFSHGDHKGHGEVLDRLRQTASEKSRNIAGQFQATDFHAKDSFHNVSSGKSINMKCIFQTRSFLKSDFQSFYSSAFGHQGPRNPFWILQGRRRQVGTHQG